MLSAVSIMFKCKPCFTQDSFQTLTERKAFPFTGNMYEHMI